MNHEAITNLSFAEIYEIITSSDLLRHKLLPFQPIKFKSVVDCELTQRIKSSKTRGGLIRYIRGFRRVDVILLAPSSIHKYTYIKIK